MYTIETLTPINQSYLSEHYLNGHDVNKVNALIGQIEGNRQGEPVPQDGDLVLCERPDGEIIAKRAHLEAASWVDEGELTVCVKPYVPYISQHGKCEASGGPWFSVSPDGLVYAGKDTKQFWTWGHMGAFRNGGVYFNATVNVWRIVGESSRFI